VFGRCALRSWARTLVGGRALANGDGHREGLRGAVLLVVEANMSRTASNFISTLDAEVNRPGATPWPEGSAHPYSRTPKSGGDILSSHAPSRSLDFHQRAY
jgi:hypothetical protein